jgi:NAD(P)-dependent dehydrogenase (short-subunit alcohol dehydrogenase family)
MTPTVIVLTGADNGIGLAMTRALLAADFCVAALDLTAANLAPMQVIYPQRLLALPCDVTDRPRVAACMAAVMQKWGRIDVLVNDACVAVFKLFADKSIDETRREFEVNYFGYLNTITAVLPIMRAQGHGLIHNMSSGVGISGFPGIYGYASTKGAIESLTRTLALEFAKYGITVNLMHPPLTNTRSAAPLGIPIQVMDNPERVGRSLARQIFSTKAVIAPDFRTAAYLFMVYRYPLALGRLFAKMTERAKNQAA